MISVIVPIYNIKQYLPRCIESILNQTYKDLEIILVNDGSNDGSNIVCENYLKQDNRIVLYNKKNGGLSDARNYALDRMKGEYVTFVDGDDCIEYDYIECLYNLIQSNKDVSISIVDKVIFSKDDELKSIKEKNKCILSKEEIIKKMLLRNGASHTAWGKLYKRELWDDIRFPLNRLYEDYLTIYKVFEHVEKVAYSDAKKYFYFQRNDSIMNSKLTINKLSEVDVADEMNDYIINKYPSCKDESYDLKVSIYLKNLKNILNNNSNDFIEYQERIIDFIKKEKKYILKAKGILLKEKIKVIFLLINKKFFLFIYNRM